ncbi:MAG: hypothetical protein KC488_08790 [Candidatus Cloacimonetes bacterium]|nr:hypothetical protein [Candidatus Cloacimonadota bacterium]
MWIGRLGDERAHAHVLAQLRREPSVVHLRALAASRRPAAVDVAIELLDHPRLARVAGETVSAIAGLPTADNSLWLDRGVTIGGDDDDALPALAADDLDAAPVPKAEQALRLPNPDEVRFWWAQRRGHFDARSPWLAGARLDLARLCWGLRELPNRQRHDLALELAARSRGHAQLSTRAFCFTQRAQLDAVLRARPVVDFQAGAPA